MASQMEAILVRLQELITGLNLVSGMVERGRMRPVETVPCINIRRGVESFERLGVGWNAVRHEVSISVYVASETWESDLDALAVPLHAAIMSDAPLDGLARERRITGTEVAAQDSAPVVGEMTMRYEFTNPVRASGLDS